jgi:peptidyl-prolyl cis-trans isomerase B (cyclophilin B)
MTHRESRWGRSGATFLLLGVVFGFCGLGCNRLFPGPAPAPTDSGQAAGPAQDASPAADDFVEARFRQPFAEATRKDPPNDYPPPPDVTRTGKSVGKIYEAVVQSWDGIRFVSDAGKRLAFHALLDTEMGEIDIELRPDWAPNHVRSFVALARAGFYDGLLFEQTLHEEYQAEDGMKRVLDQIQGGCPLGTGDLYTGNVGYWLKDEIDEKTPIKHEEGIVGACRGEEPDTGGCRFYITLCRAPFLDGNFTVFGKICRGLDVARKIWGQPTVEVEDASLPSRPLKPVVIRKVTIVTKEVDKTGPGGDN